jgi:hypothetical protein
MDDESVETKDIAIRIARFDDIGRIAAAYSEWGCGGGIDPNDTAWLAELADELIGVVRVAPEHGTFVLRDAIRRAVAATWYWRQDADGSCLVAQCP